MNICTIMWSNYLPLVKEATDALGIGLTSYSTKQLNTASALLDTVKSELGKADMILLYRTNDAFWDEIEPEIRDLRDRIPVVIVGSDPSFWVLSSVEPELAATAYRYILFNGRDNIANMMRYLVHHLFDQTIDFAELPGTAVARPFPSGGRTGFPGY